VLQWSSLSRYGRLSTSAVDCRLCSCRLSTGAWTTSAPSGHQHLGLGAGFGHRRHVGAAQTVWRESARPRRALTSDPSRRPRELERPGHAYGAEASGGDLPTRIAHGALTRNTPPPTSPPPHPRRTDRRLCPQSGVSPRPDRLECGVGRAGSLRPSPFRGATESVNRPRPWCEFYRTRFPCGPVATAAPGGAARPGTTPSAAPAGSASLRCRSKKHL
jgi:hypothetical protein